jgi:hypothetical protein
MQLVPKLVVRVKNNYGPAGAEAIIESAAKAIGIIELKEEQRLVVCVEMMFLCPYRRVLANLFVSLFCHLCSTVFAGTQDRLFSAFIMMDQQAKFTIRGISTEYIGFQRDIEAMHRITVQLLYVSPESELQNASMLKAQAH